MKQPRSIKHATKAPSRAPSTWDSLLSMALLCISLVEFLKSFILEYYILNTPMDDHWILDIALASTHWRIDNRLFVSHLLSTPLLQ